MTDPPMPKRANEKTPPANQAGPASPALPATSDGTVATELSQRDANDMSGADSAAAAGPASADREIGPDATEILVRIDSDRAITTAREHVRRLSTRAGFGPVDRALLASTVSELGRNILLYAGRGDVLVTLVADATRLGVAITACDDGPGILDVDDALRDGYSTSGRPGLGLPGIRRVCDEFHVSSSADEGTTVSVTKWRDRL